MLRRAKSGEVQEDTTAGRPARVLVVNDDQDACELLARILSRAGYEVEKAFGPESTLAQMNVGGADCVVLDLSTGGIGANLRLLESIRSSPTPAIARVRVVLIAQHTHNRMFSWQAGIDAFLGRPFHVDELLENVGAALGRPEDERSRHRRQEADAAAQDGRTVATTPWSTQRF